jgi:hypothetical protein
MEPAMLKVVLARLVATRNPAVAMVYVTIMVLVLATLSVTDIKRVLAIIPVILMGAVLVMLLVIPKVVVATLRAILMVVRATINAMDILVVVVKQIFPFVRAMPHAIYRRALAIRLAIIRLVPAMLRAMVSGVAATLSVIPKLRGVLATLSAMGIRHVLVTITFTVVLATLLAISRRANVML